MFIRAQSLFAASLMAALLCTGCGGAQTADGTSAEEDDTDQQPAAEPSAERYYEHYMAEAGMAIAEDRLQDALDAYLQAAAALDATGEVTVKRADAHSQAADMAYQRMEKDLALEEYQKSVDIFLRFKGNSRIKAAVALTNMGAIFKEKADKGKARNSWEQALQIYKDAPPSPQNNIHMQKVEQNIRDLDEGL